MKYLKGAINIALSLIIFYFVCVFCANYPLLFIIVFLTSFMMNVYFYKKMKGEQHEKAS